MRARPSAIVALTVAVLLAPLGGVVPATAALATGSRAGTGSGYPSAGQVQQAKQAAADKAGQVRQLQARLAALTGRLSAAQAALQAAAQAYDRAEIVLAQRMEAARMAQASLARAERSVHAAQTDLGRLAAQAYQSGGNLAGLDALLSSTGPQDVLDREAILADLAGRQTRVLQTLDSSRVVASLLQQQADAALAQQRQAAAALAATRVTAQAAASAARSAVAAAQSEQSTLVAQLAHLQQVSATLARQRQQALAALAAQAARAAQAAAAASAMVDPQAVARALAAPRGWTGGQFSCLIWLWTRESGWNYRATNPTSGAYGIPQSLPPDKMATAGADWVTNPVTQIRWGLQYIADAYGTPCGAWAHEQAFSWY